MKPATIVHSVSPESCAGGEAGHHEHGLVAAERRLVPPRRAGGASPAGWGLWFGWVVTTGIGLLMGAELGQASGRAVSSALRESIPNELIVGRPLGLICLFAVMGAAIGVAQWLVLRRRLDGAGWWVPASVAGAVALPLLATLQVPDLPTVGPPGIDRQSTVADCIGFITDGALLGASIGALVGLAQWPVLRRLPRSGWWVAASTVGWAAQLASYETLLVLGDTGVQARHTSAVVLLEVLLAGVRLGGVGAITGAVLICCLRQAQRRVEL